MDFLNLEVIPPKSTDVVDIEAAIEDLYMSALRATFKHDKEFMYSDEKSSRKLEITLEYPEKIEAPFSKPHLLISNISYSINFDTSIFRNFLEDKFDETGFNHRSDKATVIPYSLSMTAIGSKSVSKNLANRVVNYIGITYQQVFNELGLNIMSVNKAPTTSTSRYPEKTFETSIQIQGRLEWTGIISYTNKVDAHALSSVAVDIEVGTEYI